MEAVTPRADPHEDSKPSGPHGRPATTRELFMDLVALWTHLQAHLRRDERGASLVEYVLLVALIAVVCIAALTLMGGSASDKLTSVGNSISSAS
jgi:pilus assembly protein Flp/PilA